MARLGPLLDRCLPGDAEMLVTVALELCEPQAGKPCAPVQLAWVFLLQGIKWPPVVERVPAELRESLEIASGDAIASSDEFLNMQAPQFVDCLVRFIEWASGGIEAWGPMMSTMNSGTMWSQSGLVHLGKSMGLLSPYRESPGSPKRRRAAGKSAPALEAPTTVRRLVMSHIGTQYCLHQCEASRTLAVAMMEGVLDAARSHLLTWPASIADVPAFLDGVKGFAQAARSRKWTDLASRHALAAHQPAVAQLH